MRTKRASKVTGVRITYEFGSENRVSFIKDVNMWRAYAEYNKFIRCYYVDSCTALKAVELMKKCIEEFKSRQPNLD